MQSYSDGHYFPRNKPTAVDFLRFIYAYKLCCWRWQCRRGASWKIVFALVYVAVGNLIYFSSFNLMIRWAVLLCFISLNQNLCLFVDTQWVRISVWTCMQKETWTLSRNGDREREWMNEMQNKIYFLSWIILLCGEIFSHSLITKYTSG